MSELKDEVIFEYRQKKLYKESTKNKINICFFWGKELTDVARTLKHLCHMGFIDTFS